MRSPPRLLLVETRIYQPDYAGSDGCLIVDVAALPGIIAHPA